MTQRVSLLLGLSRGYNILSSLLLSLVKSLNVFLLVLHPAQGAGQAQRRPVRRLCVGRLECHALGALLEGNAELEQLDHDLAEVLEEKVVVLSVLLDPGLHGLVLDESVVGGKHHEALGLGVLVLLGSVPLADVPLLVQEKSIVIVGQNGGGEGPGPVETRAVGMAAAESVSTGEGDDLLIVEAHAVKDVTEVLGSLGTVGKTAIRSAGGSFLIGAARAPGNRGTLHLLDSASTSKGPEVRVGDPRELGYKD